MPAKLNLPDIYKGATWTYVLQWTDNAGTPIDLTDCTAKLHIRPTIKSTTLYIELSTENSRITITPLTGTISLYISDEATETLIESGGEYDLKVYHPDGTETILIKGKVKFNEMVTRDG